MGGAGLKPAEARLLEFLHFGGVVVQAPGLRGTPGPAPRRV